jgi:16S rRNA (cytosine967-C5)-methyltransferase
MKRRVDDARCLAASAVERVLAAGVTLDLALSQVAPPAAVVSSVRSLAYGAVRGYYRHEALLEQLLSQPPKSLHPRVRALVSIAFFELEDARTPQYAVVDAAVEAAKSSRGTLRAQGVINAVLRRYLREREALTALIAASPAAQHASPPWLLERLRADWPDRWLEMLAAGDTHGPMWLRVSRRFGSAESYVASLEARGVAAEVEPRVPQAVRLHAPMDVRDLPGFAEGAVSVQDLGAQCVAFPLQLEAGQRVLDACAAPGGKTLLIAERAPAKLVAVDRSPERLARVADNLARAHLAAELIEGDAGLPDAWWDGVPFDRILLDAPCSALGVIRRHPDIRLRRSPSDIERMPAIQRRLLEAAWRMLVPGGRLVYSTCTVTKSENPGVIAAFLKDRAGATGVPAEEWPGWPALGAVDEHGRQILPGEAGADGFYYAALTKQ